MDGIAEPRCIAVTGLAFEARIAAGPGVTVVCGGTRLQLIRSLEASLRHGCQGILSFGIAGGLAPHLGAGDCVIARNIIADHGSYASNRAWAQSLVAMIRGTARGGSPEALRNVSFGDIAGSDAPIACTRAKQSLYERTGAVAVDMESHVAARFAAEHRIPFAAFRVVTDPSHRPLPPKVVAPAVD